MADRNENIPQNENSPGTLSSADANRRANEINMARNAARNIDSNTPPNAIVFHGRVTTPETPEPRPPGPTSGGKRKKKRKSRKTRKSRRKHKKTRKSRRKHKKTRGKRRR